MKQAPQVIRAEELLDDWPQAGLDFGPTVTCTKQWVLARPLSCGGIFTRLRLAWMVFTGECDALKWECQ